MDQTEWTTFLTVGAYWFGAVVFHHLGMQAMLIKGPDQRGPVLLQIREGAGDHDLRNAARLAGRSFGHGVSTFYRCYLC
jgi:hypothetical protein